MDFFAQQDLARRNTRSLILFFILAVFLIILLINVVVAAFMFFGQDYNIYSGSREGLRGFISFFTWQRFGTLGLAVTATVALVVLFKWYQLATGGKAVAESMGGTRILPQSRDRGERRCLNVVEEMALASNMPVPAVYVLNDERGINAFAAGITPADAVIGVTRGTIDQLKRQELQGVIAHEISHILNGDMRLNIRLAAMLKGITFVGDVGHFLLRSGRIRSGSDNAGAIMPVLGIALWLLGWLGGMLAGFIKAAISRQREYLADASAVQYTRDVDGIADALKVIGGYIPGTLVHAARAVEMSHIFFGQIQHRLWQVFATHPPLRSRIMRIDPRWDGQYIKRRTVEYATEPSRRGHGEVGVGRAAVVTAAIASALDAETANQATADAEFGPAPETLEEETAQREEVPVAFVRMSHEPLGAQALVLALLVHSEEALARQQLNSVSESGVKGLAELTNTVYPGVSELGAPHRLPLLQMCLPALKAMSLQQYRVFKNTLLQLIQADQQTQLHEWCLFQLVRHYLDPEFIQVRRSRARINKLDKVAYHLRVVLSVMSYAGSGDPEARFRLGADAVGLKQMQILPAEQAGVEVFSRAVHQLADCYPLLKPRILKALVQTARYDNHLNPTELEVIASIAAVMDCPVPDVDLL